MLMKRLIATYLALATLAAPNSNLGHSSSTARLNSSCSPEHTETCPKEQGGAKATANDGKSTATGLISSSERNIPGATKPLAHDSRSGENGDDADQNSRTGHGDSIKHSEGPTEDPYKNCTVEHMTYLDATVNLGNYDFAANGKTTKDGHIVKYSCRGGKTKADGGATNYTYTYVPNGKTAPAAPPPLPPPPPPPPDPNDLALTASKTLTMPKPHIHWGPLPDQVVVNYPLWLWVDTPGAVGTSVSLRGVTVTMNATIDKIVWRTGEPTDPGNASSPEAVVECQGRGEPAPSIEEVAQIPVADRHPPCGYTYHWKSTPERTNGAGKWTLNAEVDWTLAWTSTINGTPGPRGTFALQSTNTASIQVLELKSALIANPTGSPGPNR